MAHFVCYLRYANNSSIKLITKKVVLIYQEILQINKENISHNSPGGEEPYPILQHRTAHL